MPPQRRALPRVVDINPHLVCHICDGYLVDATTVIECLHSFCRTCIVRYLENSKFCPACDVQVHKTRPLLSIRSDRTLQDVVYKLVPGLYQNEMQKRREFYEEHPEAGAGLSPEERGESDPRFISAQESISLTLQHRSKDLETENDDDNNGDAKDPSTRYLSCPAAFTVGHLKKFLSLKFSLPPSCKVDVFYDEHLLRDENTLIDIAYIYSWKRAAPMKFFYSISKRAPKLVESLPPPSPMDPQPAPCSELTKPVESAVGDEMTFDIGPVSVLESSKAEAESQDMDVDPVVFPAPESKKEVDPVLPASEIKEVVEPIISTPEPVEEVDTTVTAVVESTSTEVTEIVPISAATKMDIEEPEVNKSNSSPIEKPTPVLIAEPTYNSVKLVSAPERNTLLSPTNGFRLKFIHDPQLNPKSQKSKKSGRKGGRSSRHKSVPVRLARLAPYPPPVPVTCLTTQPLQHLPQLTVGKLVPTMITTLAPTIVTTLVSTTSSTLCNASHNSNTPQVASFINQPTTCNISTIANSFVSTVSKTVPESSIPSSNSTSNSLPCAHHVNGLASPSQNLCKDSPTNTKELPNSKSTVSTTCAIVVPQSLPSSAPIHVVSSGKDSPKSNTSISTVPLPPFVSPSMNLSNSKAVTMDNPVSSLTLTHSTTSVSCSSDNMRNSETLSSPALVLSLNTSAPNSVNNLEQQSNETMITNVSVTNSEKNVLSFTNDTDSIFKDASVDKKSESFKLSVKNSISAEFSDNDDLGCQPDLVVDEQKMDSSDIEDDTDTALRKKITAIAEKEEDEIDVTDDTEADSGVSCTAQSEDDHSSFKSSDTITPTVTMPAVTPNTSTTSSSDDNHRHIKSNNINDVIDNLYRQHEIGRPSQSTSFSSSTTQPKPSTSKEQTAKDDDGGGVLDLSTCTRKPGEVHTFRQKPVANPVLDIKHRQQAYLPAPMKQHTICAPAPKHNSSPLLLHHLTGSSTSSILHNQLTRNSKSPHHSVSYSPNIQPFSLSSSRPVVSSPSPLSGRATPSTYSHKLSQGAAHPSSSINFVPGMIPYTSMINNIASYANRNNIMNLQSPNRTSSITFPKNVSTNVNSKIPYNSNAKQTSMFTGRKSSDVLHANSPNSRGSSLSCPSPAPTHPRTSPSMMRMSPHHRSASPAPSPQHVTPANSLAASSLAAVTISSQSKPSVPIYKKQDNFKSYSHKFKGSSNLAVFNPDPNGYGQKIVIKNLDSQPNNHHS